MVTLSSYCLMGATLDVTRQSQSTLFCIVHCQHSKCSASPNQPFKSRCTWEIACAAETWHGSNYGPLSSSQGCWKDRWTYLIKLWSANSEILHNCDTWERCCLFQFVIFSSHVAQLPSCTYILPPHRTMTIQGSNPLTTGPCGITRTTRDISGSRTRITIMVASVGKPSSEGTQHSLQKSPTVSLFSVKL